MRECSIIEDLHGIPKEINHLVVLRKLLRYRETVAW